MDLMLTSPTCFLKYAPEQMLMQQAILILAANKSDTYNRGLHTKSKIFFPASKNSFKM